MENNPKQNGLEVEKIQESIKIFQLQIKTFIASIIDIQNMTKKIFEGVDFSSVAKGFQEFKEKVVKYGDSIDRFKIYIVEMGYPPHYEILPGEVIDVVELYEIDKVRATTLINKYLVDKFNSDVINQMFDKWRKSNWTNNRISIFSDIINTHNNGFYNVSIPATLAQIEGIIAQGFNHRGEMNGEIMRRYLNALLLEEGSLTFDDAFKAYYFKHVLAHFQHGKPIRSFLSRNAILHGADCKYGTTENSLKSILLLDYLHDKITEYRENFK